MTSEKLRLGLSSCLGGEKVRWDGDHKRHDALLALAPWVEWRAICPEVEIGLGVPREPIQLLRTHQGDELWSRDSRRNLTSALEAWAKDAVLRVADLEGYVLKTKSPTCGLGGARRFTSREELFRDGPHSRDGVGRWAAYLRRQVPELPLIEETALADPQTRDDWLRAVGIRYENRTGLPFPALSEVSAMLGAGDRS